MAVQAVDSVTGSSPAGPEAPSAEGTGKKDYTKMTAKEILDAEKKGDTVPAEIVSWAKEQGPDSKGTYAESQGNGQGAVEESDAVAYQSSLEEQGMSLKEQCKEFTALSAQKETRDLQNITKMGPYLQQVPADEQTGDNSTSEVTKALGEIKNDMKGDSVFSRGRRNNISERVKFYKALNEGTSGELGNIDFSLEEIQSVLESTIEDATDSTDFGKETVILGQIFKSKLGFFRFGKRKIANKAIQQGNKTIQMAERTDKLAQAVAKDNGVALKGTKDNINTVDSSVLEEIQINGTKEDKTTPAAANTGGESPSQAAGTGTSTGGEKA